MSNTLLMVLTGVVGVLVGLLISTIFRNDPKPGAENPLPKKYLDDGFAEATRLYYSPAAKKTIISLDGDFYADFNLLTPEQKKRVLRVQQSLLEWDGQNVPTAADVRQNPIDNAPAQAAFPAEEIVRISPIFTEASAPAVKKDKSLSIVEQINDYLEELVANSPEKARAIRLMDNGHEGVTVWVGLEKFNGVDAVPYPEVQELIRAAVARWEEEAEGIKPPAAQVQKK